ncbi:MAG: hypothetical protein HQM14_21925 [SAR324 cluster bacterium]|nr:hypothetical protein [SAR324 cluster bacterium]
MPPSRQALRRPWIGRPPRLGAPDKANFETRNEVSEVKKKSWRQGRRSEEWKAGAG